MVWVPSKTVSPEPQTPLNMALHRFDRMVVEDEGEGDAVVCVHGLGGSSNTFTPLMPAMARHRVLRVDLPGSGRSQSVEGTLSMGRMVDLFSSGIPARPSIPVPRQRLSKTVSKESLR